MKTKKNQKKVSPAEYYDTHGVLGEIVEENVTLGLEDALKEDILAGKRKRNLRNITIKIDPLYLLSIKKVATLKGIPYQTLVRQWFAEKIRMELKIK
jgi:predicted DNA binding CopG/RHH family protein